MGEVLRYLDTADPAAAARARKLYACFDHFHDDPQAYAYGVSYGMSKSCEEEVMRLLLKLRSNATADDDFFDAEQNARRVKNAEEYYRSMFRGREMGDDGELNLGPLVREHYAAEAASIGFGTYTGTVTASSDWDGPAETKRVRRGLPESYEALFHETGVPRLLVMPPEIEELREQRLQRAIGVIYRPETERQSHYFGARLADQFDAMIHIDETRALAPLQAWSQVPEEAPETYPTGM